MHHASHFWDELSAVLSLQELLDRLPVTLSVENISEMGQIGLSLNRTENCHIYKTFNVIYSLIMLLLRPFT